MGSVPCDDVAPSKAFPFLLNEDQLREIEFNTPYYTGKIHKEDGLALLFFSKRFTVEKIKLDKNHSHNEVRNYLGNYDEVYGVKRKVQQYIDIVFLNKKRGTIEIRLDNTEKIKFQQESVYFDSIERKLESQVYKKGFF